MADTKRKITDGWAKSAPIGNYQDALEPSLWLYVSETGARTWGFYKWSSVIRKPVRKSLGPLHERGVEVARDEARKLVVKLRDGASLTRPASADITLNDIVRGYTLKLKGEGRRHSGWMETCINLSFSDWLNRPFATIEKADLAERHQKIAADPKRGKMAAARAIHAMRSLFKYADQMDLYAGRNVAKSIDVSQQKVRRRTLAPGEMTKVMASLDLPDHSLWVRPYFRLLMLTGARRSNVASMAWKDIDLDHAQWRIPAENAKGGEPITVPLLPEAIEILKARQKLSKNWVFPAPKSSSGHLMEPHFAWKKVLELAEVDGDITIHDIRRTFGSNLSNNGVPLTIVATAMGHKNPATTARHYSVTTQEAVRDAMTRLLG